MKDDYEHQIRINYVGRLKEVIPDLAYQYFTFDREKVHEGTFRGEHVTILIEDKQNPNQLPPPIAPRAYLASRTKTKATVLARKIATESAQRFYQEAQEFLRERRAS